MNISNVPLVTLVLGIICLLIALTRPNIGIVFVFLFLYFPVLASVPVGPLKIAAPIFPTVGLFFHAIGRREPADTLHLVGWQRALLVFLTLAFFLSTLFSQDLSSSAVMIPNLVVYLMLLFSLMKLVITKEQLWFLARLIMILGFLLSIWRIELRLLRAVFGFSSLGINGAVFCYQVAFAVALVTAIMLPSSLVSRPWRIFSWLTLFSLLYHGILYQSRGGWLAWVGIIFLLGLQATSRTRVVLIGAAAVLVGMALIYFGQVIDANLAQTRSTVLALSSDNPYDTINSDDRIRLIARDAGLQMFYERPILGWGSNAYVRLKPAFVKLSDKAAREPGAFNAWLIALTEWGLLGTICAGVTFLLPLLLSWHPLRLVRNPTTMLAFAFALGVVGLAIHLFFIDLLYSFAWAHAGLALAAARLAQDEVRKLL